MKLLKKYVIVEIIPTHSNAKFGFIAQIQALKIRDDKIIDRLDLRVRENEIENKDLLSMISYDKDMFTYLDRDEMMRKFSEFIENNPLLIIDNFYTQDYLSELKNNKISVFKVLNMEDSDDVFDKIMKKYQLEPSNHLVDLLYESIVFENSK